MHPATRNNGLFEAETRLFSLTSADALSNGNSALKSSQRLRLNQ